MNNETPLAQGPVECRVMQAADRATKLRQALADIAGSKSLTATPTQFYQALQNMARQALTDDAMEEPEQGWGHNAE